MKKLVLLLILLSVTAFPKRYEDNRFAYFGLTYNHIPNSQYPNGGGISVNGNYGVASLICEFTLPGYFDFAPYVGFSGEEYDYSWYASVSPYHYMNVYIDEISGPGDGFGISAGYSRKDITATLTTIALPYKSGLNSFGFINARIAYNITSGFGVAAQYQIFRYLKDKDPMAMTSLQIFVNY